MHSISFAGKFLLELSKVLITFELRQGRDHRYFGLPRHFWETTSRQMLDNGLSFFKFSGRDILVSLSSSHKLRLEFHSLEQVSSLNAYVVDIWEPLKNFANHSHCSLQFVDGTFKTRRFVARCSTCRKRRHS